MFAASLIVFREVLEAALIIGILAAATNGIPNRNRWLWAGLAAGLAGSIAVAGATDTLAGLASGVGQELFSAVILALAVLMLAWHSIWMTVHGKELAAQARNTGQGIRNGSSECSTLFIIIAVAVLREGSETALFLYGITTADGHGAFATLMGGALGLLAGAAVGWTLYAGLLRIPLRWFFSATGTLVLLLAAGLASQLARLLIQADLLPSLGSPVWDSSAVLPSESALGLLLHALVGYDARPAGMQIIFYAAVLVAITVGMQWAKRLSSNNTLQPGAVS